MSKTGLPLFRRALLQQAAYKSIKKLVDEVLERHNINTSQWIILSLVRDDPGHLRVKDLAGLLNVEGAFVTNLIHLLEANELLESKTHDTDSRAIIMTLTSKGHNLVNRVEPELQANLKRLETGLSYKDLQTYFRVLEAFANNTSK